MDATDYPSLGGLASRSAQLAVQNRRVHAVADAQLDDFEQLLRAVQRSDWETVLRVCEALASDAKESTEALMVRTAQKVCQALRRDPAGNQATRPLSELLIACRDAKNK